MQDGSRVGQGRGRWRRQWTSGEALRWLLVAVCGGVGFAVAFVIGHDDDPYEASDWLLVVLVGAGLVAVTGFAVLAWVRRRRDRLP